MAHQGDSDGAARLFVTKIPPHVSKEDITAHFTRFGVTTDIYLPMAPGMQSHKGIAFVSYADAVTAQLAINSGPHEIGGSEVVVDFAAPRGGAPPGPPRAAVAPAYAAPAAAHGGGNGFPGGVDPASEGGRLFVTKVNPALQREHMREHFAQFGELTDVYMPQAPGSTAHKGICFISYASPASLTAALQSAPHEIHGYPVVVDVAAPRGQAPPRPGGGAFQGGAIPAANPYGVVTPVQQTAYLSMATMGGYAQPVAVQAAPAPMMPAPGQMMGAAVPGRMFVTRVTPDVTKTDLQTYFQQYGQLSDVFVPSGGKGIAFVTYTDVNVAAGVLAVREHQVKPGRSVLVDQALDRPPLGGKGGGAPAYPSAAVAYGGGYGAAPGAGHEVRYAPY